MKLLITTFLLLLSFFSRAQDITQAERNLISCFSKINYYSQNPDKDSNGDSLINANERFEKLLLKYTSTIDETINYPFDNLSDSGLSILTSKDKKFRIYSWNTLTGGTMRFYRNVFQFKGVNSVHSKTLKNYNDNNDGDPDCFYHSLSDVEVGKRTYYVTSNVAVGTSADYFHTVKIFTIDDEKLNDKAQLIKTRSGIKNEVGYEIDLNHAEISQSQYPSFEIMYPQYDEKNQTIILPLVNDNGKVTEKKILYKFNGSYFERR